MQVRSPHKKESRRGMTMLEVMVATTVLVTAAIGSGMAQMASHNLLRTSTETTLAVDELHNAMERVLLLPRRDLAISDGLYAPGQKIEAFNDHALADEQIAVTYPGAVVDQPPPESLEVQLAITWTTFDGHTRTLTLHSCTSQ
jgi:prepilin-type N-terminal cleavage/methylation domain-containing protein